jgi:hypothetical protein
MCRLGLSVSPAAVCSHSGFWLLRSFLLCYFADEALTAIVGLFIVEFITSRSENVRQKPLQEGSPHCCQAVCPKNGWTSRSSSH